MDALKHEWSIFGKTGIIILAALFAIIIACIAWFVSNREVSGTGMSVQSADGSFLLVTLGGETKDNVLMNVHQAIAGSNSELTYETPAIIGAGSEKGTVTGNSSPQINWALESTANGSNFGNAGSNEGLAPGSSGSLIFYVVPQDNTELNLTFQLTLEGYCETMDTDEDTINVTSSSQIEPVDEGINKLISGHILFFRKKENGLYSEWINGRTFSWSIPISAESGETVETKTIDGKIAYKVTLYWVWPGVFGQNLFPPGNSGRYSTEFDNTVREQLKWDMMGLTSAEWADEEKPGIPSDKYFAVPEGGSSATESEGFPDMNTVITKNTLDSFCSGTYNPLIYNNACVFYNAADQKIGNNADYLFLRLTAEKE